MAKRSTRDARLRALHQMRQLSYTAPDQLRSRLKGLSITALVVEAAAMRPRVSGDPVVYATKVALAALGRRVLALEDTPGLDELLTGLVTTCAPEMLKLFGVGIDTAATLLVTAGDNPERLRSEAAWAHLCGVAPIQASSGKVTRYRLDRGGDRNANQARWRIIMTRLSFDPRTREYIARSRSGGPGSVICCRPSGLAFARSADPPTRNQRSESIDAWLDKSLPSSVEWLLIAPPAVHAPGTRNRLTIIEVSDG